MDSLDGKTGRMYSFTNSAIQSDGYKKLKEGDEVEFDIVVEPKGPQADAMTCLKHPDHRTD